MLNHKTRIEADADKWARLDAGNNAYEGYTGYITGAMKELERLDEMNAEIERLNNIRTED